nr:MAG TPA: helix-turn-helix domain protein [Caudoviricetes sp.]
MERILNTERHSMCEKQYTIKDIIHRLDRIEQQLNQQTVVKKAYTISEIAKTYSISEQKIRELIQHGKLKATNITNGRGTRYLIDAKSVSEWWTRQLGKPIK